MSKVLKKIVKGVKKVFKKVVKVVKKIVKSDIFKVAVAAAAIYFTAGAAAGMLKGGAAAAAGSGASATTAAVSTTAAAKSALVPAVVNYGGHAAAAPALAKAAGGGILSKVAAGAKAIGTVAKNNPLAATAVLQTGGAAVSTYANMKAMDEERRLRERNSETELNVYGQYQGSALQHATANRPGYATDRVKNTDRKPTMSYDASSDSWRPVNGRTA